MARRKKSIIFTIRKRKRVAPNPPAPASTLHAKETPQPSSIESVAGDPHAPIDPVQAGDSTPAQLPVVSSDSKAPRLGLDCRSTDKSKTTTISSST